MEGSQRQRGRGTAPAMGQRRIGSITVMVPARHPPATALAQCLDTLQQQWQRQGNMGALWQRWPTLAGPQLAPHCRPLRLQGSVLTVGAAPGPWLQALQYNRHQLLGSLRAAGFAVREVRVTQHHPAIKPELAAEETAGTWALHPSRVDVHGMASCPACNCPAPAGEMARWGSCSFCRRQVLADSPAGTFAQ